MSEQVSPGTEARKFDQDKTRYDLVYPAADEALAKVYTMGAKKYGDKNYLKGDALRWGRIYAAVRRHLKAMLDGEWLDSESGLPHLAHAAWGLYTLQEYYDKGIGENDIAPGLTGLGRSGVISLLNGKPFGNIKVGDTIGGDWK